MNQQTLKTYIYDALVASSNPVPASGEYPSSAGILYSAGFDSNNIRILKSRPVHGVEVMTKPAVIINTTRYTLNQKTSGAARGQVTSEDTIQFDVLWIADMSGDPSEGVPPRFATTEDADAFFDRLLLALTRTLLLLPYKSMDGDKYAVGNWPLLDADSGFETKLVGQLPTIDVFTQDPERGENEADTFYSAMVAMTITESFSPAQ